MSDERVMQGSAAASGIAIGPVLIFAAASSHTPSQTNLDVTSEIVQLDAAIAAADNAIAALEARLQAEGRAEEAEIFAAHRMLLGDPSLRERAISLISPSCSAAQAISQAGEEQAAELESIGDEYLSARATDVRDVTGQVRRVLRGERGLAELLSAPTIVVAHDLGPSDLASAPREFLLGFALEGGGLTAHATILARALGIPAVVGLGAALWEHAANGMIAALDGGSGAVTFAPSAERLAQLRGDAEDLAARKAALWAQRDLPSLTSDGHAVTLVANAATPVEAREAFSWGAQGIGLLRTELLFLERPTLPDEAEQLALYRAVAAEMGGGPVVVRTLDVGGDKSLPAFPLPKEDNPFLGWRGIRIGLSQPEILLPQLRALLRAGAEYDIRIMLPMIATLAELRRARELLREAQAQLAAEGLAHAAQPQLGIMVEVPAAALNAEALAQEADFFSIGTNDLVQYTLACDRTNRQVAALYQPLEPAVLRLIRMTCEAAHRHGRHVAVCGEMGGDPRYTALLIGLGVDELSCGPHAIGAVRAAVRATSLAAAQSLAGAALAAADLASVQAIVGA